MSHVRPVVRAVFDCMILLQAVVRGNGPSAACLRFAQTGAIELCLSQSTILELEEVLSRPRIRTKFPQLTDDLVARFLGALRTYSVSILDVPRVFEYPRDAKDEPYINLALAANASYLVSWDQDLLALNGSSTLGRVGSTLNIMSPTAFLVELRRKIAFA